MRWILCSVRAQFVVGSCSEDWVKPLCIMKRSSYMMMIRQEVYGDVIARGLVESSALFGVACATDVHSPIIDTRRCMVYCSLVSYAPKALVFHTCIYCYFNRDVILRFVSRPLPCEVAGGIFPRRQSQGSGDIYLPRPDPSDPKPNNTIYMPPHAGANTSFPDPTLH
jgi:hypothetical protein